ncbi:hypothetical protein BASA84_000667 [Batrachochytrium salamandrivorans]|nr:hypothetical protein BASA84_000667 [Batrachochytrium salamandrivorans]
MDLTIEIENNGQSNHNQRSNQQSNGSDTHWPSGDLKHFCTNCNRTVSHQTNDCCNKPQFSYSSNISQLHSTYDSVFITQHTPTIKTKDTEKDMAFMAIANSDDLISDSGATAHMTFNLISECCLEEKGCTIESSKNGRIIYDKYGNVAFIANRHNKLNKLNCKIVIPIKDTIIKDKQDQSLAGTIIKDKQDQSLAVSSTFKSPATISVWNQRLGHLSDSGIQTLTKRAQVKAIFSDNGGKFKSRDSDAFSLQKKYLDNSRHHTFPQQTGTVRAQESKYYGFCTLYAHALRTPALIMKLRLRTMQCIMLGYATAVALSTAETEYVAATTATQELLFLKTFLTEIGYPINKTTTLYSDSQSAISNIKNIQLRHASNKHMDIKLYFLKDQVKLGTINLKYIYTLDQVADILTKGPPKPAFCKLANLLGCSSSRRGGVFEI